MNLLPARRTNRDLKALVVLALRWSPDEQLPTGPKEAVCKMCGFAIGNNVFGCKKYCVCSSHSRSRLPIRRQHGKLKVIRNQVLVVIGQAGPCVMVPNAGIRQAKRPFVTKKLHIKANVIFERN